MTTRYIFWYHNEISRDLSLTSQWEFILWFSLFAVLRFSWDFIVISRYIMSCPGVTIWEKFDSKVNEKKTSYLVSGNWEKYNFLYYNTSFWGSLEFDRNSKQNKVFLTKKKTKIKLFSRISFILTWNAIKIYKNNVFCETEKSYWLKLSKSSSIF